MISCATCSKEFKNGAALNFHTKKAQCGAVTASSSSPESVDKEKETAELTPPRRKRGRPPMLKFGKYPGVDHTKGPFKVSQITMKSVAAEKEVEPLVNTKRPKRCKSSMSSEAELENEETVETNKNTPIKCGGSSSSAEVTTSTEAKTPPKPDVSSSLPASPGMPVLSPQVTTRSRGRPCPKRSKQGRHWKYNDEYEYGDDVGTIGVSDDLSKSAANTNVSNGSRSPTSSRSGGSGSRKIQMASSAAANLLEAAIEEKRESERLESSGNSSRISNTSSIHGNDQSPNKKSSPKSDPLSPPQPSPSWIRGRTSVQPKPVVRSGSAKTNLSCPVCAKTAFRNSNHYTNHLEIHEGKRPFVCPVPECEMGYETEIKLMEHVTIRHLQEAKFTCPNCEIEYKTQRGLEKHKCC